MKYDLLIRKHNILPHLDIEKDIQKIKNGRLSFTLRVNNGNIVDKNVTEFIDLKRKYLGAQSIITSESSFSCSIGERGLRPGIWSTDGELGDKKRES